MRDFHSQQADKVNHYLQCTSLQYDSLTIPSTLIFDIVLEEKKDFDATYFDGSEGSDNQDINTIKHHTKESVAAVIMMGAAINSLHNDEKDKLKSSKVTKKLENISDFQNDHEENLVIVKYEDEEKSGKYVPHVLEGQSLLSKRNIVALKLCLKEFKLPKKEFEIEVELGNDETDLHRENKKIEKNEDQKRHLSDDSIEKIIEVMPQTVNDLPGMIQREELHTQKRLLHLLYYFLDQNDILHLFPILSTMNCIEKSDRFPAANRNELSVLHGDKNEIRMRIEDNSSNKNDDKSKHSNNNDNKNDNNDDNSDKERNAVNGYVKYHNNLIELNRNQIVDPMEMGNIVEKRRHRRPNLPLRLLSTLRSSSSSSTSPISITLLQALENKNNSDCTELKAKENSNSFSKSPNFTHYGRSRVIDRHARGGDSLYGQIETSMSGKKRMRESSVLHSSLIGEQLKSKEVNPVEMLRCSDHHGGRAEARTGKGMGRWTGTGMGTGTGAGARTERDISGGAEMVKETVKEREKEKETWAAPAPAAAAAAAPALVSAIETGRETGFGGLRGRSGGTAELTKGMVGTKDGRVGLGIENIHINLRKPFRSTTMISKSAAPTPAPAVLNATAIPPTSTAPSSPSSSSSSSSSSSYGAMMRRGLTVIRSPMKISSHDERTLQRRNTVAGSVLTHTGTGTSTGADNVTGKGTGRERRTGTGTGVGSTRGLCVDTGIRNGRGKDGKKRVKCVEVVRKNSEREGLPGHICTECTAFYGALQQQGIVNEDGMEKMLQRCSRHKVTVLTDPLTINADCVIH